jgi:multidrug resistance efflux pump
VVAARRGPITELLTINGRIAGAEEIPLMLPAAGRVDTIAVKQGQEVQQGDLLLQTDSKDIVKQLAAARARSDASTLRFQQTQARVDLRQRQAQVNEQDRVAQAEADLRRAQAELDRVRAGASAGERRAAEEGVRAAQAGLQRAEAFLSRVTAGPRDTQLRTAQLQVDQAQLAVQKAEASRDALLTGPDQTTLRAAEVAAAQAQSAVDRSQAELARLQRGPDPAAVASAERQLERAQNALKLAQSTTVDSGKRSDKTAVANERANRDAAIANAQLGLQDAQDRLAAVRQGPAPYQVEIARRDLEAAQAGLVAAQDHLDSLRKGPDQLTVDSANAAVESAHTALDNALSNLAQLQGGPPADQVYDAKAQVDQARAALTSAMTRLAEVNSHPTPAELLEPTARAAAAEDALARARNGSSSALDGSDLSAYDVALAKQDADWDGGVVESLERDLNNSRLVAPFTGAVVSVLTRPGDSVTPEQPVIVLAKAGDPIVRADVTDRDAARLLSGQQATIRLDGDNGTQTPYAAVLTGLSESPIGIGRVAQFDMFWRNMPPTFGSAVRVAVTLQQKQDALLVPQKAIRTIGQRRTVEYLDGASRRTADVEVGIVSGDDAEIVKGLSEGQLVLVGP